MTSTTCHCSAPARNDGGDYSHVCTAWPHCTYSDAAPVSTDSTAPAESIDLDGLRSQVVDLDAERTALIVAIETAVEAMTSTHLPALRRTLRRVTEQRDALDATIAQAEDDEMAAWR